MTPEWLAFMSDRAKRDGRCEINLIEPHFLFRGLQACKKCLGAHGSRYIVGKNVRGEQGRGAGKKDVSLCTQT